MKRKWWVLAQQGNGRQSPSVEPFKQGVDHLTGRRAQGVGIVKDWEDKRDRGHKTRNKKRKTRKSRSEEKVVDFSSASLYRARKWGQSPKVEPWN